MHVWETFVLLCFVLNHFKFSNADRERVRELIGARERVYDYLMK